MLPPYDSRATLDDLAALIAQSGAEKVFCLGDNYHDDEGEARLEGEAADLLQTLTQDMLWIWISGNHDRDVSGLWGGDVMAEWIGDGLALRHEATADTKLPEISGHFHPKLRVPVRGRHVSRRCFVKGQSHLIMPAFGALTGGMAANDPVIEQAVAGPAEALIPLKEKLVRFDLGFTPLSPEIPQKSLQKTQLSLPLARADN